MNKHPKLAKKLKLLYQLKAQPKITNNQQLANVLGVSRQAVSKWGTGSVTQSGDAIPDAHFFRIGQLFGIDSYLFTLEFEEFEKEVRLTLGQRSRALRHSSRRIFLNNLPVPAGELFGREAELAELGAMWQRGAANVVQVVGIAGAGKSAIVTEWLSRLESEQHSGLETVFSWSFHGGYGSHSVDSSPSGFFACALALLGDRPTLRADPESRAVRLVQLIRGSRTLLLIDGVQDLQCSHGPGFGQFQDAELALLIRELAKENPGLCVLTSRYANPDLGAIGAPRANTLQLAGLGGAAATAMLRSHGAIGAPRRLARLAARFDGLPLLLRLLGQHLDVAGSDKLAQSLELAKWLEERGEGANIARVGREYLARLQYEGQRKLFYLLSLLKRPTSLREMLRLCRFRHVDGLTGEILSLTQQELRSGILAFEQAGLVRVRRQKQGMIAALGKFAEAAITLDLKQRFPSLRSAAGRLVSGQAKRKQANVRRRRQKRGPGRA